MKEFLLINPVYEISALRNASLLGSLILANLPSTLSC